MNVIGRFVFQGHVWSLIVINCHGPFYSPDLQDAKVRTHLSGSCLFAQAVRLGGSHNHSYWTDYSISLMNWLIKCWTVLQPSVRVMYLRICRFSSPQSLSERFTTFSVSKDGSYIKKPASGDVGGKEYKTWRKLLQYVTVTWSYHICKCTIRLLCEMVNQILHGLKSCCYLGTKNRLFVRLPRQ